MGESHKVVIVGGGLSGCLQALYWSKKKYKVDVYESRPDPRTEAYYSGWRSMNLTLSERGIAALRSVNAEEGLKEIGVRLYGRVLHSLDGKTTKRRYGNPDHYILSVKRQELNQHFIKLACSDPNVTFHFEEKLVEADFNKSLLTVESASGTRTEKCGLIVGCDGTYSKVRELLMKSTRMNYWQLCLSDGYKQLEIPPTKNADFAMDPHYLHIWPRSTFLLVALPNRDKTFTVTWFMAFEKFEELKTDEDFINFFSHNFPDVFVLFEKELLLKQFRSYSANKLITIKCSPYHYHDKAVFLGDAAHAVCPFYGQGVNCAFEDCMVLHEILDKHNMNIAEALAEYSIVRNPDAEAIVDLTLYNYIELRSLVTSKYFVIHRKIDAFMYWLMPKTWIPLYIMTQFTNIGYYEVMRRSKYQDRVIKTFSCSLCVGFAGLIGFLIYKKFINYVD